MAHKCQAPVEYSWLYSRPRLFIWIHMPSKPQNTGLICSFSMFSLKFFYFFSLLSISRCHITSIISKMYHQDKAFPNYREAIANVNVCLDPVQELAVICMLGLVFSTTASLSCCQMWKIHNSAGTSVKFLCQHIPACLSSES